MKLKHLGCLTLAAALLSGCGQKWTSEDKGSHIEITQKKGATLGYSASSGVQILTKGGYAFKDLNKNGKLDKYEDWRLSSEERAKDLASQLSLEEIAGLMLYSSHQTLPAREDGSKRGTYNGKPFSKSYASPEDLTDQQLKFIIEDKVRHILITKVQNAYTAAEWNNNLQALCESIGHGIPANNSSDPRHRGSKSGDEFDAGGASPSPTGMC